MSNPAPPPDARLAQGSFAQAAVVALGAGLASAALFGLSAQGSLFSALLAAVAPMPVMAAALGFTHWTGLLAGLLGGLGLSAGVSSALALLYFGALAAPAWQLARVASSRRPDGEWRSLRELALWAVGAGVLVAVGWIVVVARHAGGDFDAAIEAAAAKLAPAIEEMFSGSEAPKGVTTIEFAAAMLRALPAAAAGSTVSMMLGNLWLAGRVTRVSGLATRPWPDVARDYGMPRVGLALLAGGLALALLDGMAGLVGWILVAATFMGFALQGLATAHVVSRGWAHRRTTLLALYVLLAVIPWTVFFAGLLGVVDSLFGLRARKLPPTSI